MDVNGSLLDGQSSVENRAVRGNLPIQASGSEYVSPATQLEMVPAI